MTEARLSVRELRMFVAAYEERSFTAAAAREHATQSGVSQHIRHIEERLQAVLFDRKKGMEPTAAGAAYYERCLAVLRAFDETTSAITRYTSGIAGEARVGVTAALAGRQLASAFSQFQRAHPNATAKLVEAGVSVLIERVLAGDLDAAILPCEPQHAPGLVATTFARVPLILVSSRTAGMVHRNPFQWNDICVLGRVLPVGLDETAQAKELLDRQQAAEPRFKLDAVLGALDLIRRSDWKAVLPGVMMIDDVTARETDPIYVINPLYGPGSAVQLVRIQARNRQPPDAALTFLDILRDVTLQDVAMLELDQPGIRTDQES